MEFQLKLESKNGLRSWYVRVPTECNLSDLPSRSQPHELLCPTLDVSSKALVKLQEIFALLQTAG
jgi:hypothetical protein